MGHFARFGDLEILPFFRPKAIFHTKVLKDGPTPRIGAMRAKYLWVGSTCANKETYASGPAHMKNKASEKKIW